MNTAQNKIKSQAGITLIELLTTITIIGILAATSVQAFSQYRQIVYDSINYTTIRDAETALQAGHINILEETDAFFWAWSDATGTILGWRVSEFMPGFKLTKNERISVNANTWCSPANIISWCPQPAAMRCCITQSVRAWHCKGRTAVQTMRWNNGEIESWEMGGMGC